MKAFVFSDLHAQSKQLHNLEQFLSAEKDNFDLIIFAGDLLNMGEPVGFVNNFIEVINKIGLPFFWVPGNNDFGRSYHKLAARYPTLEGKVSKFSTPRLGSGSAPTESVVLTGVGGSPASWAGQYAGETMIDRKNIAGSIFVSHVPPPGILVMNKYDWKNPNFSVISTEAEKSDKFTGRRFGDSPLVHICGHQHSRWGCGYLGTVKVINPGPLAWGQYVILDTETLEVTFERFKDGHSNRV